MRQQLPRGAAAWLGTLVAGLAPGVFLLLTQLAAGVFAPAWSVLAVTGGVAVLRWPGSLVPLACWAGLWLVWALTVGVLTWLVLPAAAVTLLGHCACAWLDGAPLDGSAEPALVRAWAGRLLVVVAVAAAVLVAGLAVGGLRLAGSVVLTMAAALAAGGWALLVSGTRVR